MKLKIQYIIWFSIILLSKFQSYTQSCAGSLGDPVVRETFGTGTGNAPLPAGLTNYTYQNTSCPNDGNYKLTNATSGCFGVFHTLAQDHTSGDTNGRFMMVNAAYAAGEFYKQTVNGLCPNTTFELSAYVLNMINKASTVTGYNKPNITLRIESTTGTLIKSFASGDIPQFSSTSAISPSQWTRIATFFTVPAGTSSVVLKLINNGPGGTGNDLILDDIEFRPCGPTVNSLVASATSANLCINDNFTLSSSISAGYTTPQFQWQESPDQINWTNISGATALTFNGTVAAAGTKYYRMLASETGNIANATCRVASNVLTITAFNYPVAPTASNVEYCVGATAVPLTSTAASGGALKWYTTPTGGSSTASITPNTTTAGTTPYFVTQTVNGCESTTRTQVDVLVSANPKYTVTTNNACIGGGNITFTSNAPDGGTWSVSGGGTITSAGVFTATTAGCFIATYTIASTNCSGASSFLVYPQAPVISAPANTCNAAFSLPIVAEVSGFTIQYSVDGAAFSENPTTPSSAGCHTVKARYVNTAACGNTAALTAGTGTCSESNTVSVVVFPQTPVLVEPTATCNQSFQLPSVAAQNGFTVQYSIDGAAFTANPNIPSSVGCHTITARYVTAASCGSTTLNTAGSGACGNSNTVSAVIFPTAPTLAAISNTCNSPLAMPSVPVVAGFNVAYSVDNGPFSASSSAPSSPGCHYIRAQYALATACGSLAAGSLGNGSCAFSNTQYATVFPAAPTAPTAVVSGGNVLVTAPASVVGFTPEYSFDNGNTWTSSNAMAVADNCSGVQVKTRYTAQACGSQPQGQTSSTAACGASPATTIIKDTTPPATSCPANVTVNAEATSCTATVNNINATSTDACGIVKQTWVKTGATTGASPTTGINNASGTVFNTGTTTVTYTSTDVNGLTSSCSFTVTVNNIPPTISCPANVSANAGTNCEKIVDNIAPTSFADNCGTPTISYQITGATTGSGSNNASGTSFATGTSTVVYTITDSQGATATCSFTVTINDVTVPVVNCLPTQEIVLEGTCADLMPNYTALASSSDNCGITSLTQSPAAGTAITAAGSPYTVTLTATDAAGNSSTCSFLVNVIDSNPIEINCAAAQNLELDVNCSAILPDYRNLIASTDLCGTPGITITQTPAPGTVVNGVGTMTVTFEAMIGSRMSTCSITVNKVDTTAPSITCPVNVTLNTTTGACTANVTNLTATATDACGTPTFTYTLTGAGTGTGAGAVVSGLFTKGVTNVSYIATDPSGNQIGCQTTVTVNDTEAPTFSCPSNISENTTTGACNKIVTYTTPVGVDNCSDAGTVQTAGLASGSSFPTGTTTNTFVVTDAAGNTTSCSFTVTITDAELPQIICPANISQNVDAGTCSAVVNYTTPVGIDNCTGVTTVQTTGIASGALFPVGTTTNTFKVTDAAGNTADCSFTVTITDNELPQITCPANITHSADAGNCTAIVNYTASVGTDNCAGAVTVQTAGLASGAAFPVGVTTNTFKVTDAANNTSECSFTVTITDNELPQISCPANINQNTDAGLCTATVTFATSAGTDNCSGATTTLTSGLASGSAFPIGTTTNIYTVTDAAGNSTTCSFTITITDTELPQITCPANISQNVDAGNCTAVVNFIAPVGTDNCAGATTVQTAGLASGAAYPVGVTTNTFKVTDAAGNTAQCSFTVTVVDNIFPQINCPANVSANVDAGLCTALLNYSTPVGTDNCTGATTMQTGGLASGSAFPVGTTTNIFTVTDAAGNTTTCSFTITVADNIAPVISCPENINQFVDAGACTAIVNYTSPVGTDNCAGATTSQIGGLASGGAFPVGVTINTFRVTDAAGNTTTCSFTINITDNIAPTISCPANINANVDAGQCGALVTYTTPVGSDNCAGATTTQIAGLASGATFPVGTTTNTFEVTDAAGNKATCSFTVTVTDNINPQINCPANISQNVDAGNCAAMVTFTAPVGTDNCPGASTVQTAGLASGASFPLGVTTNTFTVTDAAGNTATCSFTVTVTDNIVPAISCPANISQNVDANSCTAVVIFNSPVGTDNCSGATTSQTGGLASGSAFPIGTTNNTYKVTDAAGNTATCSFTITVIDIIAPQIFCPPNQEIVLQGACADVLPNFAATATTTDNCAIATTIQNPAAGTTITDTGLPLTVTLTTTDVNGNSSTCSFEVSVKNNNPVEINCAAAQNLNLDVNCSAVLPDYTSLITSSDICGTPGIIITQNPVAGTVVTGVGTLTVIFTAMIDTRTTTCSITVNKIDTTDPALTCPANVTINSAAGTCTAVVNNIAGVASDGCNLTSVTYTLSGATVANSPASGINNASGQTFNLGETLVTYIATDASGNISNCSFVVKVVDAELPLITCPSNILQNNDADVCGAAVTFALPTATDNCTTTTIEQTGGLASGSVFPLGVTTNIYKVTDGSGNSATCSFTVTITDTQLPTISCPAPIVQGNDNGLCGAVVSYTAPTASDNCLGVSVVQTAGLASGSLFPTGITTNTFKVTDAAGNTAECSFTVTINDTENPVISCPPAVTVECQRDLSLPINSIGDFVSAGGSVSDNCTPNALLQISYTDMIVAGDENCEHSFNRIFTITDEKGNASTCGQLHTIDASTAPVVPNNGSANIECLADATPPVLPEVIDVCGNKITPTLVSTVDNPTSLSCNGTRTYTYNFKDCANLESTWIFVYNVVRTTAPVVSANESSTVQCVADAVAPVLPNALDGCGNLLVATQISVIDAPLNLSAGGTRTYTYSFKDCAGLETLWLYEYTIDDTQNPTASDPATIEVFCYESIPAPNINVVTDEADNCGVTTVSFVEDNVTALACADITSNVTFTRTYLVTDQSGNTITVSQEILVKPVAKPTATDNSPTAVAAGTTQVIPILANDKKGVDGNAPTDAEVLVELIAPAGATTNTDGSITVPGEGTYSYSGGQLTFDPIAGFTGNPTPINYTITELLTGLKSVPATVSPTYEATPPIAANDTNDIPTSTGTNTLIDILDNDTLGDGSTPGPADVTITLIPPDGITANTNGSITIPNQGTYSLNPATGEVTFDPIDGFKNDPTPIGYIITDNDNMAVSSTGTITPDYDMILPINILTFEAKQIAEGNQISWTVSNESNFSHFIIEKSIDGKYFETLFFVKSQKTERYAHTDENVKNGTIYYRLKLIDIDGTFSYSKTISVHKSPLSQKINVTFENPIQNKLLVIKYNMPKASIKIIDSQGKTLPIKILQKDSEFVKIDLRAASTGIYYMMITNQNELLVRKIVVL
jgi:CshA-type fibril repeat protein